jgi:hypothetical protein
MLCGSCPYTDGCCYTSLPPKVKCIFTGEFHFYNDECNCEEGDFKARKIEELEHLKKLLSEPWIVPDTINDISTADDLFNTATATINMEPCTHCVRCAICGTEIPVSWFCGGAYICEDCKKTIRFIKEKFKEELCGY